MESIFTKIIKGEIPAYKVAENEEFIAFLDVFPLERGHTLVVPKIQIDYIFDLEPNLYQRYWAFAQQVAKAVGHVVPCIKVGVAVIGLEVPHAHIHLVPLNTVGDLNFSRPKQSFPPEVMEELAQKIKEAFNNQ
jgi:histidine triad (HIT) family protein